MRVPIQNRTFAADLRQTAQFRTNIQCVCETWIPPLRLGCTLLKPSQKLKRNSLSAIAYAASRQWLLSIFSSTSRLLRESKNRYDGQYWMEALPQSCVKIFSSAPICLRFGEHEQLLQTFPVQQLNLVKYWWLKVLWCYSMDIWNACIHRLYGFSPLRNVIGNLVLKSEVTM